MTIQEDNRILKEGLDYIEHHGIKGMHWGITNKRTPPHINRAFEDNKIVQVKRRRQVKTARQLAKESAIAGIKGTIVPAVIGAILVGGFLKLHHDRNGRLSDMHLSSETAKSAADFIKARHATELSSLTKMHTEGHLDAEQFANFSRILKARYDRKLVDAALNHI